MSKVIILIIMDCLKNINDVLDINIVFVNYYPKFHYIF